MHLPTPASHRIFHLRIDDFLRATRPALLDLVKVWYLRRGETGLPARAAFDAPALKALLPQVFIAEHECATGRYRYRLIGTAITDICRRNATGCYFDEIYGAADLDTMTAVHDATRTAAVPQSITGKVTFPDRAILQLEALLLPLGVAEGQHPQLLGAVYFQSGDIGQDLKQTKLYSAA